MKKKSIVGIAIGVLVFTLAVSFQASEKEPIKIGAAVSLTGMFGADGLNAWRGIEMAVEDINNNGGLLGRQLEVAKFDIQELAPEVLMQAADNLMEKEKVNAVFSGWSGWGQEVTAFGRYDVPAFTYTCSFTSMEAFRSNPTGYSNVFMGCDEEWAYFEWELPGLASLPYDFPNKKIALLGGDDEWGRAVIEMMSAKAKELGWEVVMSEIIPYGVREWRPILTKLKRLKPAIIYMEMPSVPETLSLFEQFKLAPINSLLHLGFITNTPDFMNNIGDRGEGLLGSAGCIGNPPPNPEAAKWIKSYADRYKIPNPSHTSVSQYVAVKMWAEAVKTVGNEKDYKAVNAALRSMKYRTFFESDVFYTDENKMSSNVWPIYTGQIQGGEWKTLMALPNTKSYGENKFQAPPWIK